MKHRASCCPAPDRSRRRFLQGLAASGLVLGLPSFLNQAWASSAPASPPPVLRGREFDLSLDYSLVNFTGNERIATTVNGSIPAPTLIWKEGETVTIRVTNNLRETSSLHWHGILLPYQMDGVPGISYAGIAPGETFTYRFRVRQSGTYWYHSHSGMQEQTGMYGAIVIEPANGESIRADREHVVLLSDWTDEDPMRVYSRLKTRSDYYNQHLPTAMDFFRDASRHGINSAFTDRRMWNQMRMNPTDLADLSSKTLSYLMNGAAGNWTGLFRPKEKLKLRFINGASNTFYDLRIPGLKLTVVAADGQAVDPVTVDEFRFGPGETYDVMVEPEDDAYTIFAQSMDRTGFARGTLAVREGLVAAVPELDRPQWLNMADMMGDMAGSGVRVRHASTEYGPGTDMRVDKPRINLDDPGVGLRNNGRRVLTLEDLATVGGPIDARDPEREIELHLTGNMDRYTWSIDGLEFGKSTPVHFRRGERLRVILHNDTMMTHPMHLHGMWSELESEDGSFLARRHTIPVQPAQRISFRVSADAPGRWPWHCHLMFHMDSGMFREVVVA